MNIKNMIRLINCPQIPSPNCANTISKLFKISPFDMHKIYHCITINIKGNMKWKLMLTLFIIIGITGLLLFSDKARDFKEKYLGKYIKVIGSYLSELTGRLKTPQEINRTLAISLEISLSDLKGLEFNLAGNPLKVELKYDTVSVGGQNIKLKDEDVIDFETESMSGNVKFDQNGKMIISGNAGSIELDGMIFLPQSGQTTTEFNLVGVPSSFSLDDFEEDTITLTGISGLLTLSDWSPLALEDDTLEISYFRGSIQQDRDSVSINAIVEKVRLNGVDLSLKS